MKNINTLKTKSLFFLFLGIALPFFTVGCGGGGSTDTPYRLVVKNSTPVHYANGDKTKMSINIEMSRSDSVSNAKVKLQDFVVKSDDCDIVSYLVSPKSLLLQNPKSTASIEVDFTTSSACPDAVLKIEFKKIVTSSQSESSVESKDHILADIHGMADNTQKLYLQPDKITVSTPYQKASFKAVVLDANDVPMPDVSVKISSPTTGGNDYGLFDKYVDVTDSNGTVIFNYFAPKSLSEINGTDKAVRVLALVMEDRNLTSYLHINFKAEDTPNVSPNNRKLKYMSIVYNSTDYQNGIFYDDYIVHCVDENNHPAYIGKIVNVGVVGGLDKSSAGRYLKLDEGKIGLDGQRNTIFSIDESNYYDFSNVKSADTLVILANENRNSPDYMGGWRIDTVLSDYSLGLAEEYYGESADELTSVIGTPKRYDECHHTIYGVDLDKVGGQYLIDSNGIAHIRLKYDPFFVGKDVFIYANTSVKDDNGSSRRVGVALRQKLYGNGIEVDKQKIDCAQGEVCTEQFHFYTKNDRDGKIPLSGVRPSFTASRGSSCTITLLQQTTGCDGSISVRLVNNPVTSGISGGSESQANASTKCSISWTGALYYEYE